MSQWGLEKTIFSDEKKVDLTPKNGQDSMVVKSQWGLENTIFSDEKMPSTALLSFTNPDKAIESQRLSSDIKRYLGEHIPPALVDPESDKRRIRAVEMDHALQGSPDLQRWIAADPSNAELLTSEEAKRLSRAGDILNSRTVKGTLGDIGVTAIKGAMGLPQAFVGIADIPTGGHAGKLLESIGLNFTDAQRIAESWYSPEQKTANRLVQQADGFLNTIGAAIENPSVIAATVGESIPAMLGGAGIARGLLGIGAKTLGTGMAGPAMPGLLSRVAGVSAPVIAGATGEGIISAGAAAEQIRGAADDKLLSVKQSLSALGSGAMTGVFALMGGKIAQKFGIDDIDTALVKGTLKPDAEVVKKGFVRKITEGGISEGLFEELPQSAQEQMWQNFALDRPITEGVGNAAALGFLSGAAMGGGFNAYMKAQEAAVEMRQAEVKSVFDALHQAGQESELRAKVPEKYREFVEQATKGGAVENVFIPAEQFTTYFQSVGIDPSQAAKDLGVENLADALALKTDVVIPTASFATLIAGTDHYAGLSQDLRLHQGDMTAREAELWKANEAEREAEMQKSIERIIEESKKPTLDTAIETFVKDIEGQIIASGRGREFAKQNAQAARGQAILAQRAYPEKTPEEIIQMVRDRYDLQVSDELPAVLTKIKQADLQLDPLIETLRSGKWATDKQIYGASLSQFLRASGGLSSIGKMADESLGKNLIRKNGMSLDAFAERAVEAGYFPGREIGDVTEAEIMDALQEDVGGNPIYSANQTDERLMGINQSLDSLFKAIQDAKIDLKTATNEQVRAALQKGAEDATSSLLYQDESDPSKWLISISQVEQMLERLFNINKEMYREEGLKSWRELIPRYGVDDVAMTAESEYTLYDRYLRNLPEGVYAIDVLNAYEQNTLQYKAAKPTATQPLATKETGAAPKELPYAQKKTELSAEQVRSLWDAANQRTTKSNKAEVNAARLALLVEHNARGISGDLGIRAPELNKKLHAWSNWNAKATALHNMLNAGKEVAQQWWGISNVSYLSKENISPESVDRLVASVAAPDKSWNTPDGEHLRRYIMRTLLGIDTGIEYTDLEFVVESTLKPLGLYEGNKRRITIRANSQHTVAHEIGHYLDNKWAREVGNKVGFASDVGFTFEAMENATSKERAQWMMRFREFVADLGERAQISSAYHQDNKEVFARFVDQFLRWTETQAGVKQWGDSHYTDKFHDGDYKRFVKLLQEKAYVDINDGNPLNPVNDIQIQQEIKAIETKSTDTGNILYQTQSQQWYYSALAQAIETAPDKVFAQPASGLKQWIQSNSAKLGIKQDELQWTGLLDWLDTQGKARVTREQVGEYLAQGGVQLQETVLDDNAYYDAKANGNSGEWEDPSWIGDIEDGEITLSDVWGNNQWSIRENDERDDQYNAGEYRLFYNGDDTYNTGDLENLQEKAEEDRESEYDELAREDERNAEKHKEENSTKFGQWKLSGGTDYREFLLTLPKVNVLTKQERARMEQIVNSPRPPTEAEKAEHEALRQKEIASNFRSSHWDQPNVVAHMRVDTVEGDDGKQYLRVIEIQSDWSAKGRKEGFSDPAKKARHDELRAKWLNATLTEEEGKEFDSLGEQYTKSGIPAAPFVTDTKAYVALIIKRAIALAAQEGMDGVVFVSGQESADLYDLSKQISKIELTPELTSELTSSGDVLVRADDKKGSRVINKVVPERELSDVIGKELADRYLIERQVSQSTRTIEYSGLDLKVGGEGMLKFYDEIIPQVANTVLKQIKAGVKVETIEADTSRLGFIITPEMRAKVNASGLPLFQKEGKEKPRGYLQIGADRKLKIKLTPKANLSTFLHEMGHVYLEMMADYASDVNSSQQVKNDFAKIMKWAGVEATEGKDVNAVWNSMSLEEKRPFHEKFARANEAYLREGKAPSPSLRGVFQRFAAWLKQIYKDGELRVELSDEVRGVFDRIYATDAEIEAAAQEVDIQPMPADVMKTRMTEAEYRAYSKTVADIANRGKEQLQAQLMREFDRGNKQWWKEERAKLKEEVTAEVDAQPAYAMLKDLLEGEKLSKTDLEYRYGASYLNTLPRGFGRIYAVNGGMSLEVAAVKYGYDSGDAMIKALAELRPRKELIEAETDLRMRERHGDLMNDPALADKAIEALHNDRRAEALEIELKAMGGRVASAQLKRAAEAAIGRTRHMDIRPYAYLVAGRKAAREAFNAAVKGELPIAMEAKQRELLNHHMYVAATAAKETAADIEKHMLKLRDNTKLRSKIGKAGQEWLGQVDDILVRFSFSPISRTLKSRTLAEWAAAEEEKTGETIAVSPMVMDEAYKTNWREMTMDELIAIDDTLKSIKHVANKITKVMLNGQRYELEQIDAMITEQAAKSKFKSWTERRPGDEMTLGEKTREVSYLTLRPEKIIELLDNGKTGLFHDIFWDRAVDAQVISDDLHQSVILPLLDYVVGEHDEKHIQEKVHIPSLGVSLKRYEIIGVILNTGNASNLKKLQAGGIWKNKAEGVVQITDQMITEMKATLNEADYKMIGTLWESVEKLYPHLDDLNRRAVGLPLPKIEAIRVDTPYGTIKGGYWPAVPDKKHSEAGRKHEATNVISVADFFPSPYTKAATKHSFREERTDAVYPINFDWRSIVSRHISQATTDVAYNEFVNEASRILKRQAVHYALSEKLGEVGYNGLMDWLKYQANVSAAGQASSLPAHKWMRAAISNTAVAALGYKAATAIGNIVVAPIQASHQVKGRYMAAGYAEYMRNPTAALKKVREMSGEMRHRHEHLEATFNAVLDMLAGKTSIRAAIARNAMAIHTYADMIATTGIWLGKYNQTIDEYQGSDPSEAHKKAVRAADKTLRTSQTAGAPKDLSAFERDPTLKIFTLFAGPMIIMQNELRGSFISSEKRIQTMFAAWFIPALLFELAVGRGPDDDEEEWQWMMRKLLTYPMQLFPIIRDASSAVESLISDKPMYGGRANPVADIMVTVAKAGKKILSEEADAGDKTQAVMQAGGFVFGLPGSATGTASNYLIDLSTGEVDFETPLDLRFLFYKRKDDKND